jgi:hypothetical protein
VHFYKALRCPYDSLGDEEEEEDAWLGMGGTTPRQQRAWTRIGMLEDEEFGQFTDGH